jgi:chromosome segregation ATPase
MEPANGAQPCPPTAAASTVAESRRRPREALRIQVAAVAAQQAALTEAEIRIEQRRTALEQQERQLAAHLEEKRCRLVALRDDAHTAQDTLGKERQAYEQRVAEVMRRLATARQELAADRRQADAERRRLQGLHRRLKQRYHRHWAAERAAAVRREAAVAEQVRALERQREQLHQEQATLADARLRFNGEVELGRRQLQEERDAVRQEQAAVRQRAEELAAREAACAAVEQKLAAERRQWEVGRQQREVEAGGLERRIGNQRQKIQEQEREVARLEATARSLRRARSASDGLAAPAGNPAPTAGAIVLPSAEPAAGATGPRAEASPGHFVVSLEQIAGELADQRLYLAEQMERLAQARQRWQHDREAAATELEALGIALQQREALLRAREETLAPEREALGRQAEELARNQRELDVRQALAATAAAEWEGARDRLLAGIRCREAFLNQRLIELSQLRQLWDARRRRQVLGIRRRRAVCEELRREYAAQRTECLTREALLAQEQRALAERALALEQYRQTFIARTPDPKAADKRLKQLRGRWAAQFASAKQILVRERRLLEAETARLEEYARQLGQQADDLDRRETELAGQEASREEERLVLETGQARLRQELATLQRQREHYEHQVAQLRDEVDRLARLLLEESDAPASPTLGMAA